MGRFLCRVGSRELLPGLQRGFGRAGQGGVLKPWVIPIIISGQLRKQSTPSPPVLQEALAELGNLSRAHGASPSMCWHRSCSPQLIFLTVCRDLE